MTNVLDAYPFDTGPGANSGQTRWQKMAKVWAGNGVVPQSVTGLGGELSPTYNSSQNNITVSPGAVNINGTYGELAAATTVGATGDGLLVAKLDNTGDQITVNFNLGAVAPVQSGTTWEIVLAKLASGVLTDQRVFCGPRGAMPAPPGGAGVNTYTDANGTVWASKAGSAWKPARDVVKSKVYRNAAWTPANNTPVPFDSVTADPLGLMGTASPYTTFTCPIPGDYWFSTQVVMHLGNGGAAQTQVRRNQSLIRYGIQQSIAAGASLDVYVPCSDYFQAAAGDQIDVVPSNFASSVSGGALGFATTWLSVRWMGPT